MMNPQGPPSNFSQKSVLNNLWKVYPHSFAEKISNGKWKPFKHLRYVSEIIAPAIAKGGARIIVEMPPRHGKSQLISRYTPAWFLENWPDKNVILCSYEADFAANWGRAVRNIFAESPHLTTALREDSTAANRFNTTRDGGMITAGIGGPITGRGGDLIIIDDPVKNHADALSATKRESAKAWFESTLHTRAEPGASIIILQTRWHQDDLAGWLQNSETERDADETYQVIRLPALAEDNDPLGREVGEALCPERYSAEKLLSKQKVSAFWFSALYQQRPTPLDGGIIKRSWFKYYEQMPQPNEFEELGQFWDLAFKDTAQSDFVVGLVWGRIGAQRYLLDRIKERMNFPQTLEAFIRLTQKWPAASQKIIEDKANGPALISTLQHKIPGIIPWNPESSKEVRLHMVSHLFEAGNVMLPHPSIAPWVNDYVEELVGFPNMDHDDQVDATSMALLRMMDLNQPNIYVF